MSFFGAQGQEEMPAHRFDASAVLVLHMGILFLQVHALSFECFYMEVARQLPTLLPRRPPRASSSMGMLILFGPLDLWLESRRLDRGGLLLDREQGPPRAFACRLGLSRQGLGCWSIFPGIPGPRRPEPTLGLAAHVNETSVSFEPLAGVSSDHPRS